MWRLVQIPHLYVAVETNRSTPSPFHSPAHDRHRARYDFVQSYQPTHAKYVSGPFLPLCALTRPNTDAGRAAGIAAGAAAPTSNVACDGIKPFAERGKLVPSPLAISDGWQMKVPTGLPWRRENINCCCVRRVHCPLVMKCANGLRYILRISYQRGFVDWPHDCGVPNQRMAFSSNDDSTAIFCKIFTGI